MEELISESINDSEDEFQQAIKESLKEQEHKKDDKKQDKDEKLSREMDYHWINLKKNDYIVTSKGIGLLTTDKQENSDDIGKTKFKVKIDSNKPESILLENLNYSLHKSIKVHLVNYLDKVFQLYHPVNVNDEFIDFKDDFCDFYNLNTDSIAIIFKNNKLGKKDLEKKKFGKDFDFNNDYLIILQAKTKPCVKKLEFYRYHNSPGESLNHKFIFTINVPITLQSLFLNRAHYRGCRCNYTEFELSVVNAPIENFKSDETKKESKEKKKVRGKKKQKKENAVSAYSFDKIFKSPDQYEFEKIKAIDMINADNFGDDDEDSYNSDDSYNFDAEEKDDFKEMIKKKVELAMDDVVLSPETIYQVKFKLNSYHETVECYNFKTEKMKKSFLKDGLEMIFHIPVNPQNSSRNILYFGGIGYTIQTMFEKDN